jgi:hypothetical protein
MTRLSYLQDYEVAIQSISEELDYLKRYLASGGKIDFPDMQDLSKCLERLQKILGAYQEQASEAWQVDQEPLPEWLQPNQTKSGSDDEDGGEPGSVAA